MRRAIREGLAVVKTGGSADVITLDGETSRDVDAASKDVQISRTKFLLESIRVGFEAAYTRLIRDKWARVQDQDPQNKEAESWLHFMESRISREDPMMREVRTAMRQRGAALNRLWDILTHVPEAWRRYQLVEQLTTICKSPGGRGGGVWGMGLTTGEIEWQVRMHEKYGYGALPAEEIAAREPVREREKEMEKMHRQEVTKHGGPPYPEE
jgi:hypothetical protein